MQKYIINGGKKLFGKVQIAPAKNACLPIIASAIMLKGEIVLQNAPKIEDVIVMAEIVKDLGGSYNFCENGLRLQTQNIFKHYLGADICKRVRASFFVVGALLSRFKSAIVSLPGGCKIGKRPIDIHLDMLSQFGVVSKIQEESVYFNAQNAKSSKVRLKYPSVGATVNAICLAVELEGESLIYNCAKEPEIVDLCIFLKKCGYKIEGEGKYLIKVVGKPNLNQINVIHQPILDRIEAGTFLLATAICKGEITFNYPNYQPLKSIITLLNSMGAKVYYHCGEVAIKCDKRLNAVKLSANVFPAFPTDLQSPLCALCAFAKGESIVIDKVFKERFAFVNQLINLGVNARVLTAKAKIVGKSKNFAGESEVIDLRGGAGLVLYSLGAKGRSVVSGVETIRRGYENFDGKLRLLGADIQHIFY